MKRKPLRLVVKKRPCWDDAFGVEDSGGENFIAIAHRADDGAYASWHPVSGWEAMLIFLRFLVDCRLIEFASSVKQIDRKWLKEQEVLK